MQLAYNPYMLLPLFAALMALVLAYRGWRYRTTPLGKTFLTLMFALAWWSLAVVMEHSSLDLPAKVFWMKMSYFGITAMPIVWLAFSLQYTDREKWLTRRNMAILIILPVITLVMVWTNNIHHLMWKDIWLETSLSSPVDAVTHNAWFWVYAAYAYSLLLLGTLCLLGLFRQSSGIYRKQAGTLLLAAFIPWVGNILFIAGIRPFTVVDPTPLAFALTGLAFFWALSRQRLLDIMPIAHEAILRSMVDGVIVLDTRQRIIELNPAAEHIIDRKKAEVIGQPYNRILPGQAGLLELKPDMTETKAVIALGEGQGQRYFRVYMTPISTQRHLNGYLVLLHDDTERLKVEVESRKRAVLETELNERKQAEKVLRESEERYRTLFESASEGIVIADIETKELKYANPAICTMLGYNQEELTKMSVLDIHPKTSLEHVLAEFGAQARGEKLLSFAVPCLKKDDTIVYADINATHAIINGRECNIGFFTDITERKQAEERLKMSEGLLKEAQKLGRIGSWEFDIAKQAINWSEETYILYERDPKLGPPSPEEEAQYYSPDQLKILRDYTGRARATGQAFSYDFEVRLPSGKRAYYHSVMQPVKGPEDKVIKLSGTVQDITERKLVEEALRISEEYNSSLIEGSPYPIEILNLDTSLRYVNPAFEKLTGYTNNEISGVKPPFPWWVQEYIDQNQKLLNQGMQTGLEQAELPCRKKNGELFWVEVKSVAKPEQDNVHGYYLSIWTDITERKKTEEELSRLNTELRLLNLQLETRVEERTKQLEVAVVEANSSNQAKSNFLASMSHELRTPLNAVIGFAQVLQQQYYGPLNEKQAKHVGNIMESGKHLLSLISDILDLSKIEAGKDELVLSNIKIKELLEGSLVMVKEKAADHGIRLELQIPADVNGLEIKADDRKVKQIMFNLLSNAVKFTPDGGYVTVKCIRGEKELIIRVSDSGVGITQEQQKKLFERFYQVSGGIANKTPGTGLGLALAKHMTEMQGGRMWVESEGLGKGSCFAFTLPLQSVLTKENT